MLSLGTESHLQLCEFWMCFRELKLCNLNFKKNNVLGNWNG